MSFLPIVDRELRVRARQPATFWFRMGGAVVAFLIVVFMLMVADLSSSNPNGSDLFGFLAGLAFLYCVFEGVRNTADCLSEEKREGTLGLLFLTNLRGYDIVLGKLIATSLNSFYTLLAIVPPLAIPVVLGGVTGGEFWRVVLVLVATLILAITCGLGISTIAHSEGEAWGGAVALLFVLSGAPAAAFWLAFDVRYATAASGYWGSCLMAIVLSGLVLAAASATLTQVWRNGLVREPRGRRRNADRAATRKAFSPHRVPVENPALWLARREMPRPWTIWLFAVVGVVTTGMLWHLTGNSQFGTGIRLMNALIWHLVLGTWVAWVSCRLLAQMRRSGLLELLLGTPLTGVQITESLSSALRHWFHGPALVLLGAAYGCVFAEPVGEVFAAASLLGISVTVLLIALIVLLAVFDLHAASWYGLWLGLRWGKVGPALMRTVLFVLLLPMAAGVLCLVAVPLGWVLKNLFFMNHAHQRLQTQLRAIAMGDELPKRGESAEDPGLSQVSSALPNVLEG